MKASKVFLIVAVLAVSSGSYWYAKKEHLIGATMASRPDAVASAAVGRRGEAPRRGGRGGRGSGLVTVVTEAATAGDFPVLLRSIGYVDPVSTILVKSRIQSQLLEQHFKEGQMVKKGQLLFTLDDKELAAQVKKDEAAILRDEAALARARADLARAKLLMARNAGTQRTLDLALADEKTALANLQGDKATLAINKLRLSYANIYAPAEGRIGAVNITPGNLVNASEAGSGLVSITQVKPVRVTFTLPEKQLFQIRSAMAAAVAPLVKVIPNNGYAPVENGKLTFVDTTIDRSTGTITLKAEFANDDLALWPGVFCNIELQLGTHKNMISVPEVALQVGQEGNYVYVIKQGAAERRIVTAGLSANGRIEIPKGLQAGEKVVIDGQLRLTDKTKVSDGPSNKNPAAVRKPGTGEKNNPARQSNAARQNGRKAAQQ